MYELTLQTQVSDGHVKACKELPKKAKSRYHKSPFARTMRSQRALDGKIKSSDQILSDYLHRIDQLDLSKIINDFNLFDKQIEKIQSHYSNLSIQSGFQNVGKGRQHSRNRS